MSRVSTVVGSSLCLLSLLGSAQSLQLTEKMQLFFPLVMEAEAGLEPCSLPDSTRQCCKSETYSRGKGRRDNRLTHGCFPEL